MRKSRVLSRTTTADLTGFPYGTTLSYYWKVGRFKNLQTDVMIEHPAEPHNSPNTLYGSWPIRSLLSLGQNLRTLSHTFGQNENNVAHTPVKKTWLTFIVNNSSQVPNYWGLNFRPPRKNRLVVAKKKPLGGFFWVAIKKLDDWSIWTWTNPPYWTEWKTHP